MSNQKKVNAREPELRCTRNYDLFIMHDLNRPLHNDKRLMESMTRHGFMPSSPIQVVTDSSAPPAKYKIIRGHNRFNNAVYLGLPVYFVVDETVTDIYELECGSAQWTNRDFAESYSSGGNTNYSILIQFAKEHGISMAIAANLLIGQTATSHNVMKTFKQGQFSINDMAFAQTVVSITDECREVGIQFATSVAFVAAVSCVLHVDEFDKDVFIHKVRMNPMRMAKRSTRNDYLKEIEELYNYGVAARSRIPLQFRANQIMQQRKDTFGRN